MNEIERLRMILTADQTTLVTMKRVNNDENDDDIDEKNATTANIVGAETSFIFLSSFLSLNRNVWQKDFIRLSKADPLVWIKDDEQFLNTVKFNRIEYFENVFLSSFHLSNSLPSFEQHKQMAHDISFRRRRQTFYFVVFVSLSKSKQPFLEIRWIIIY